MLLKLKFMNPNTVPERSRETKEKLNDNSSNILLELSKLIKQSNKNSGSQEVCRLDFLWLPPFLLLRVSIASWALAFYGESFGQNLTISIRTLDREIDSQLMRIKKSWPISLGFSNIFLPLFLKIVLFELIFIVHGQIKGILIVHILIICYESEDKGYISILLCNFAEEKIKLNL